MAKYIPVPFEIKLRPEGFVFAVGSLFEALLGLHDQRDARGLRYALVTVLVFVLLAKLAGEDSLRGIAQWVAERREVLTEVLGLAQPQAPCYTTYGRILGYAVAVEEFEQVVDTWVAGLPGAGHTVAISLDGKTLRGTIPFGQTRGVHLLAAYFPGEGLVFAQVAVESRENEIRVAPQVLKLLDLWQHPCHLGTGENRHRGCAADPAQAVDSDCGRGRGVRLAGEREPTRVAPGPPDGVCPRTLCERVQPCHARLSHH